VLREKGYDAEQAKLGASLSQGSVTRALDALSEDEEGLRRQVASWFFRVVEGETPEETWATRETLDDGLEILKTLVRDWVALSGAGKDAPILAIDYAKQLRKLPHIQADTALGVLSKVTDAQQLARTNVSPALVGDVVRMALTGTAS
jgi:hypothetical protein